MSVDDAELAALTTRRKAGLGDDAPVPDIVRLVEDQGAMVFILDSGRDGPAGGYERDPRDPNRPLIFVNAAQHPVRQRFTIAHEYGHHVLGHGATPDAHMDLGSTDPHEIDAHRFAAALLVPQTALDVWLSSRSNPNADLEVLVRAANFFGVSAQAMLRRLRDLNRLHNERVATQLDGDIAAGRHMDLAHELGLTPPEDTVATAFRAGRRLPADMQRVIDNLLARGLLDEERARDWLGLDPDDFASWRRARQTSTVDDELPDERAEPAT